MEKDDHEKQDNFLRKAVDKIYTPHTEAQREILKRWNDEELKRKVDEFLGGDIPDILKEKPKAILARQVATPNFEQIYFIKKAQCMEIEPIILEHTEDTFSAGNPVKYFLGKMMLLSGRGKKNGDKVICKKIIDFDQSENKPISKVLKLDGQNFVDFHHDLFGSILPDFEKFDCSAWTQNNGKRANGYFKYFLALYLRNGILFENFLTDKTEEKFTREIVLPAFKEIENNFGIKPLIVRLLPLKTEGADYWYWYPCFMKKYFKNIP